MLRRQATLSTYLLSGLYFSYGHERSGEAGIDSVADDTQAHIFHTPDPGGVSGAREKKREEAQEESWRERGETGRDLSYQSHLSSGM
jgi:hypothetical protein